MIAWLLTLPASALIGGFVAYLLKLLMQSGLLSGS